MLFRGAKQRNFCVPLKRLPLPTITKNSFRRCGILCSFWLCSLLSQHRSQIPPAGPDTPTYGKCAQLGLTGHDCGPDGCSTVEGALGCEDWVCVCEHFPAAIVALSSILSSYCTSQQDVASATSILNGFCAQLTAGHDIGVLLRNFKMKNLSPLVLSGYACMYLA